jgi:hypothetical protein
MWYKIQCPFRINDFTSFEKSPAREKNARAENMTKPALKRRSSIEKTKKR